MSETKRYLVLCDQAHRENLKEIAERLQTVGCKIERTMDKLGIVAVSVEADKLQEIQHLEGVVEITSGDQEFHAI